jgi:L-amino acid N-acyltransferase YncA
MKIRLAQIGDLPAIVDIYNQAILTMRSTADTQPVHVEERKTWFLDHPPENHPIFVAEIEGQVTGWCSLSAYRTGRAALRYTAEISYYIARLYYRKGIATALIKHAIAACPALRIKNIFAIVLERNETSLKLLEEMGFEKWGYLPRVADFEGEEMGQFYYGKRVWDDG